MDEQRDIKVNRQIIRLTDRQMDRGRDGQADTVYEWKDRHTMLDR